MWISYFASDPCVMPLRACNAPQSLGGCPQGTWIHTIRMQCQHLLVKLHSGRGTRRELVEVADITARFLDVMGRAIGIKHAMTGYRRFWMQSLDFIAREATPFRACSSHSAR